MNTSIPLKIHYCWFGGNPLPELAKKCIASWQKFLPNYEIKRWDETNFDLNSCNYIKEAYQAKKWAFVSDYARFSILYKYGGLYFDTDVEIIKPFDDILCKGAFMGLESDAPDITVNPGLGLAAKPGLELYKDILNLYHKLHFINPDGTLNTTTVVAYTTEILKKYGLMNNPGLQKVANISIYPKEYFCPKDYLTGDIIITPKTVAIHHYDASWWGKEALYTRSLRQKIGRFLPKPFVYYPARLISFLKFHSFKEGIKLLLHKFAPKK